MSLRPLPVASHGDSKDFFYGSNVPWWRVRYLDSLFTDSRVRSLVL